MLPTCKNSPVTLPETNSSPLKMDGWNTSFLSGWPIFRGYVSFRECTYENMKVYEEWDVFTYEEWDVLNLNWCRISEPSTVKLKLYH